MSTSWGARRLTQTTHRRRSRCCRHGRCGGRSQLLACRRCSSSGMPARATTPGTRLFWPTQPCRRWKSCVGAHLLLGPATARPQASRPGCRRAHGARPCMGPKGMCTEHASLCSHACAVPLCATCTEGGCINFEPHKCHRCAKQALLSRPQRESMVVSCTSSQCSRSQPDLWFALQTACWSCSISFKHFELQDHACWVFRCFWTRACRSWLEAQAPATSMACPYLASPSF